MYADKNMGYSIFDEKKMSFRACLSNTSGWAGRNFEGTFQMYTYVEAEKAWGSEVGPYHKWQYDGTGIKLSEGARGDFVGDRATVTGSVPPFVVLFCAMSAPNVAKVKNWRAVRQ